MQDFNTNNFPLQKYIIDVNNDVSPPSYLNEDSCFELITKDDPVSENSNVKVLNYDAWPPRDAFGLDESQFEAFRAALTKQFVIIQGPPGYFNYLYLINQATIFRNESRINTMLINKCRL